VSRYRRKVDANQAAVTRELRQLGCFVEPALSRVGGGCPDLLVGYRGRWHLVELKDPAQPPSARALTDDEAEWIARANPYAPVIVATGSEEIMEVIR
jgi:hypothetical protein